MSRPASLITRFWSKVECREPNECWPWRGNSNTRGYGRLYFDRSWIAASRFAWELANGQQIPADLQACHICDNPNCVNPAHIWPGTQSANQIDSVEKGRHWKARNVCCSRGHPFDQRNTLISINPQNGRPFRQCRECNRLRCNARYARRKIGR